MFQYVPEEGDHIPSLTLSRSHESRCAKNSKLIAWVVCRMLASFLAVALVAAFYDDVYEHILSANWTTEDGEPRESDGDKIARLTTEVEHFLNETLRLRNEIKARIEEEDKRQMRENQRIQELKVFQTALLDRITEG